MNKMPNVLLLSSNEAQSMGDAQLIHAVAEADVVRLQWPPPARYLLVLLSIAPAHRLLVWKPHRDGPKCPENFADRILEGPADAFPWPQIYEQMMRAEKKKRSAPRDNYGHVRGDHDIGTTLFLALHGGHACPLRPEAPEGALENLVPRMLQLHPQLFSGALGLQEWVKVCPNEPWLHFWMGVYDHAFERHTAALMHFGRVLQQGLRHRFIVWFIHEAAVSIGMHRLARLCVRALAPHNLVLPSMEYLARRYRGGAADTPLYPLLPQVWRPDHVCDDSWRPLRALCGWYGLEGVRSIWLAGAHYAREFHNLRMLCPNLTRLVLLEPVPDLFHSLEEHFSAERMVTVLPYAANDHNGEAQLQIASDQGYSSSILPMAALSDHQPQVKYEQTITVATRTLEEISRQHRLPPPNLLILSIQGMEGKVLDSLSPEFLSHIRLLFTKASTEEMYEGAKPLSVLKAQMRKSHRFMGFYPISGFHGKHGSALFLSHAALGSHQNVPPLTIGGDQCPPLEHGEVANLQFEIRNYFMAEFSALEPASFRPIYIWGAGQMGRRLLPLLQGVDLPVEAFIDNDEVLQGTTVLGLPVKAPKALIGLPVRPLVAIASARCVEIEEELAGMHYKVPKDVVIPGFKIN